MEDASKIFDDYIVTSKILGRGAYSFVKLAVHATGDKVAMKITSKEENGELISALHKNEVELLNHVKDSHKTTAPFFIEIVAAHETIQHCYILTKYAHCGSLFNYLKGPFKSECALFYLGEILQGLEHLHNLEIVHLDLKPHNILLSSKMHIKIADFNSSKFTHKNNKNLVGTLNYMSPEMLDFDHDAGKLSDIWAWGVIMYQMFFGALPFTHHNFRATKLNIKNCNYKFPDNSNELLNDVLRKIFVVDLNTRLGSTDHQEYTSIKTHDLFENINFDELHMQRPPRFAYEREFTREECRCMSVELPNVCHQEDSFKLDIRKQIDDAEAEKPDLLMRLKEICEFCFIMCQGEVLIYRGEVAVRNFFGKKKLMILHLTSGPRLFLTDLQKRNMSTILGFTDMTVTLMNPNEFHIRIKSKTFKFYTNNSDALFWHLAVKEGIYNAIKLEHGH